MLFSTWPHWRTWFSYFDGKRKTVYQLEEELASKAGGEFTVTISPETNTPIKHVVTAMDLARKYEVNAILAAEDWTSAPILFVNKKQA